MNTGLRIPMKFSIRVLSEMLLSSRLHFSLLLLYSFCSFPLVAVVSKSSRRFTSSAVSGTVANRNNAALLTSGVISSPSPIKASKYSKYRMKKPGVAVLMKTACSSKGLLNLCGRRTGMVSHSPGFKSISGRPGTWKRTVPCWRFPC